MNTRAPETGDDIPAGLRSLWKDATSFVTFLFGLFTPAHLRTTGISREKGARLSTFLLNLESGIRRIILAAALAFTPPVLRPRLCAFTRTSPDTRSAQPRRPGLCIIRIGSTEPTPATTPQRNAKRSAPERKPYGHIPFPADPLLSLARTGAITPPSTDRITAPRTRNPLDRWVRRSRRDPDWRPPEPAEHPMPRAKKKRTRPQRNRPQANEGLPESLYDWRRQYDAWTQPVPAPDFAARLEALQRLVANPHAIILKTARRLHAQHALVKARASNRPIKQIPPRRARHIHTVDYIKTFARNCHARLLDTS